MATYRLHVANTLFLLKSSLHCIKMVLLQPTKRVSIPRLDKAFPRVKQIAYSRSGSTNTYLGLSLKLCNKIRTIWEQLSHYERLSYGHQKTRLAVLLKGWPCDDISADENEVAGLNLNIAKQRRLYRSLYAFDMTLIPIGGFVSQQNKPRQTCGISVFIKNAKHRMTYFSQCGSYE